MTKTREMRARMMLHGYTIKALADKIGVCEQNLALKINGKREFRQKEIAHIGKALGLTPSELYELFLEGCLDDRERVC